MAEALYKVMFEAYVQIILLIASVLFTFVACILASFWIAKKRNLNKPAFLLLGVVLGSALPGMYLLALPRMYLLNGAILQSAWLHSVLSFVFWIWTVGSLVYLVTAFLLPQQPKPRDAHEVKFPVPLPPGTRDWGDKR